MEPEPSNAYLDLKKNSFYNQSVEELKKLNEELAKKTFLNGFEKGEIDDQKIDMLKDTKIDETLYPNLNRWYNHMNYLLGKFQ